MVSKFDKLVNKLSSLSFFVESPDYYEGGAFHDQMNFVELNKSKTKDLIQRSEFVNKFKNFDLYKFQHPFFEENVSWFLVNNGLIEGAIEISTRKGNNFCLGVWQRNVPENRGLIRQFFVEQLPLMYNSIISDKTANKHGFEFWKRVLNQFAERGFKITVLQGSLSNEKPFDPHKFNEYWTSISKLKPSDPVSVTNADVLFKVCFKQL